jgi:hypothetical protein
MDNDTHRKQLIQTDIIDWTRILLKERIAELETVLQRLNEPDDLDLIQLKALLEQNVTQSRRRLEETSRGR